MKKKQIKDLRTVKSSKRYLSAYRPLHLFLDNLAFYKTKRKEQKELL